MENNTLLKSKNSDLIDASIIIPCKNEGENLKFTVDSIMKSKNHVKFEIIVIDDGCNDKSTEFLNNNNYKYIYRDVTLIETKGLGCASARNKGAKVAKGKYLFFCDAHIKVTDLWLDKLINTFKETKAHIVAPSIINIVNMIDPIPVSYCYGMTVNEKLTSLWLSNKPNGITEIPFACGCALGISKEVFENIYGFDDILKGYGSEDFEICLKAWLYGYRTILSSEVEIQHLFKTEHSYEISTSNTIFNILCVAYSHFKKERIMKTMDIVKNYYHYLDAVDNMKLNIDRIISQREKYLEERTYDDDFFFKKFNIHF